MSRFGKLEMAGADPAALAMKFDKAGGAITGPVSLVDVGLVPEIISPAQLYAVGDNATSLNIYFANLIKEVAGAFLINWDVVSSYGQHKSLSWTYTPADAAGNGATITVKAYSTAGVELAGKTFTLNIAPTNAGAAVGYGTNRLGADPPNIGSGWGFLFGTTAVNNVITSGATGTAAFKEAIMASGKSYRIAGSGTAQADGTLKIRDGLVADMATTPITAGAWSIDSTIVWASSNTTFMVYTNSVKNGQSLTVTNLSVTPVLNILYLGDSTVNNPQTIIDLRAKDAADSSLFLGWVGTQDAPNNNEGYDGRTVSWFHTDPASPFVKAGAFNYSQYLSDNSLATPNVVIIQLGINDCFALTTDADVTAMAAANITRLDAMIAGILAKNSYTRIGIVTVFGPSDQDKMGTAYGSGQTLWRLKRNYGIYNKALAEKSWNAAVSLVPAHLSLDTANNMTTGVHPDNNGYQQIADVIYAWLKMLVK